ncbi:alpha/beta hydrolase [Actinoplanes sp. TBRC 11911]|uniref:alpha/beta hydrolase n=1 Tax=Actinoplanes sp. TBRC 11911 TaxID=2729386 RepID=UPI001B7D6563|nr:alpha/beta hydrolase [Actinoplanes sp. TBRC 11911]
MFLLVHGGYHTPATWLPLQQELAANGWRSEAIRMPSAGDNPTAGLYDDADTLAARLRQIDGPVIVVGHSHSGLTISQLDDEHPNVLRLIYVAAFMPIVGESAASAFGIPVPEDVSGVAPREAYRNPRETFYSDLSDEAASEAIGRLVDQSLLSCVEPTTRAAWQHFPSTYVICERDRQFPVALQEKYAAQATTVERLPTGHMPMLSAPARLAAVLETYAA